MAKKKIKAYRGGKRVLPRKGYFKCDRCGAVKPDSEKEVHIQAHERIKPWEIVNELDKVSGSDHEYGAFQGGLVGVGKKGRKR